MSFFIKQKVPDRKTSVKDETYTEIYLRGATLIHGNDPVRLSGYQHIPGN